METLQNRAYLNNPGAPFRRGATTPEGNQMNAHRIQRKRTKGWRMPEGAVYVGRPGGLGNPFRVGEQKWIHRDNDGSVLIVTPATAQDAVDSFREYYENNPLIREDVAMNLAGRDLACWCPLDQPCHADVLLEWANQ